MSAKASSSSDFVLSALKKIDLLKRCLAESPWELPCIGDAEGMQKTALALSKAAGESGVRGSFNVLCAYALEAKKRQFELGDSFIKAQRQVNTRRSVNALLYPFNAQDFSWKTLRDPKDSSLHLVSKPVHLKWTLTRGFLKWNQLPTIHNKAEDYYRPSAVGLLAKEAQNASKTASLSIALELLQSISSIYWAEEIFRASSRHEPLKGETTARGPKIEALSAAKPAEVHIHIGKLQEKIEIHTTTLQESLEELEELLKKALLKAVRNVKQF